MVAASRMTSLGVGHYLTATLLLFLLYSVSERVHAQELDRVETRKVDDNGMLRSEIPAEALPYIPPPTDFPPDQWGNRIADFSQVGYRRGNIPLPQVPIKVTLQPSSDPRINDRARIQDAIDWVGELPLQQLTLRDGKTVIQTRGAVLLQAGIYRVQGALILNKSGVVLRGEGNGPAGTTVMAMGQFKHDFIILNGMLDSSFQGTPKYLERYGAGGKAVYPKNPYIVQDRNVARIVNQYVPAGTKRVPVTDTSNFRVGKEVILEFKPKASWVHLLGTDNIPPRPGQPERTVSWDERQYVLRYVRKIIAIENTPSPSAALELQLPNLMGREEARRRQGGKNGNRLGRPVGPRYGAYTNRTEISRPVDYRVSNADAEPEFMPRQVMNPLKAAAVEEEGDDNGDDDDDDDDEDDEDDEDEDTGKSGILTFDIPTVMNMDPAYSRSVVYNFKRENPIPTDVGVENLALWSEYDPNNVFDERHAWFAVFIDNCQNCWATDIKATNFVSGIKAAPGSKHVTIQDCKIIEPISLRSDGGRRYMYMLQGQMALVKRCFASDARHDFMTGSKTPGPNVFVDSEGIRANNDAGPHDRWATGTLYDNIRSHGFNIRNRGWMGSGQGWPGVFHAAYRCSAEARGMFQSPPGGTNWIIDYESGVQKSFTFNGDTATFLNLRPENGKAIPRSLYWSQLVARVGGNRRSASILEKHVGVAGKNIYPPPLPMRFTQMDEILASEKPILASLASAAQKGKGKHANFRWEVDVTSTTDIQKEIRRFEQEFADEAEV